MLKPYRMSRLEIDPTLRRALGARIKDLRKMRGWTQKELATKLGVHLQQLNRYESGSNVPSPEKLVVLASSFDTTVDYLLTGSQAEKASMHDRRLLERFRAVQSLSEHDKETAIRLLDALIVKHRAESAVRPIEVSGGE